MSKIKALFVPEVFNRYITEQNVKTNRLIKSGIMSNDARLNALAERGGKSINMPFFKQLGGDDELLTVDNGLTPGAMEAGMDVATLIMRGRAFDIFDLESSLSGEDVVGECASMIAEYWNGRKQTTLMAILEGVFKSPSMETNIYKAGGPKAKTIAKIDGASFIQAKNKLGDKSDALEAVIMHSAVFAELETQNLIAYIPNSQGVVEFPTYMGKKVIVDDECQYDAETGVYNTYLFGRGAIGYGQGRAQVPSEIGRDHLKGIDTLVHREHYLMHPRGVKFTNANVAKESPTNAELKDGANWERVYEPKNVKIVLFQHTI